MFYLTRERQKVFQAANLFPFGEEFDSELEEKLYEDLANYLDVIPQKFQKEILERTLFSNNDLMNEFEEWCNETIDRFIENSGVITKKRYRIIQNFQPSVQNVFIESLHDGEILKAEQEGNDIVLLLNMDGGFTKESIVQLVFHDAKMEGNLEGYYLHDELDSSEDGFGLRIISGFGCPHEECTIYFKDVTANCLYRPAIYSEPGEIGSWSGYVASLNPDNQYFIVKNCRFVEIDLDSLSQKDEGIFAGDEWLGRTFEEAKEKIHCARFEDPYAYLNELLPAEKLGTALFDKDPFVRLRAFNTLFELGEEAAGIVNDALRKIDINDEENMDFETVANYFHRLDCLDEDVKRKWIRADENDHLGKD
ncbi:DUF4085 family protein [Ureibacillus sp. FSL K6-8385]|nr:DUF4085 family protein [Ureibacillus terrenus]MED3661466.1 DUF4085 family protein [Ureibacillus terrenus]MED3763933.1 DUF4085 family protein [Ureibacillus terrenus]